MSPSSADVERLVRAHPFHAHRWYGSLGPQVLEALAVAEAQRVAGAPVAWVEVDGAIGLLAHTARPDEAAILGHPVVRCGALYTDGSDRRVATAAVARAALEAAVDATGGRTLVVLHVDIEDAAALVGAQEAGFRVYETGTIWVAPPDPGRPHTPPPGLRVEVLGADEVRNLPGTTTGEVIAAAGERFRTSHFHADPAIDAARADELYRRWAARTLDGSWSDQVITVWEGARLVGFAGFAERTIGTEAGEALVMCDAFSLALADGPRGVGTALFETGLACFPADLVEYRTQLRSTYARLFARSGRFSSLGGYVTLHGWAP